MSLSHGADNPPADAMESAADTEDPSDNPDADTRMSDGLGLSKLSSANEVLVRSNNQVATGWLLMVVESHAFDARDERLTLFSARLPPPVMRCRRGRKVICAQHASSSQELFLNWIRDFFPYLAEVNEPDAKFERHEIRAGGVLGSPRA